MYGVLTTVSDYATRMPEAVVTSSNRTSCYSSPYTSIHSEPHRKTAGHSGPACQEAFCSEGAATGIQLVRVAITMNLSDIYYHRPVSAAIFPFALRAILNESSPL